MTEIERSRRRVDRETKDKALREYYAGHSPTDIIARYGFNPSTFYRWIDKSRDTPKETPKTPKKKESNGSDTSRAPAQEIALPQTENYIAIYESAYEFDKAKLQQSAINGYCEGICRTNDLLQEVLQIEDTTDRIYCTLAILKERRCIQDRIIKVFSEITTSSNEYEQMFGKLFNITEAVNEH